MPVLLFAIPQLERLAGAPFPFAPRLALYVGGSMAVGVLLARMMETPALRLRDRQVPLRARGAGHARPSRTVENPGGQRGDRVGACCVPVTRRT